MVKRYESERTVVGPHDAAEPEAPPESHEPPAVATMKPLEPPPG
jgi:hypothetical protein